MKNESTARFQLVEPYDDVIIAEFPSNTILDLDVAIEIVTQRLAFTDDRPHFLVVNVSNVLSLTAEAKKYLQDPAHGLKNILGAALIASSPLSALIANIFIKTPTAFQSRFFSSTNDALRWIGLQKKERQKTES